MLRADDFLSLEYEFFNLKLLGAGQGGPGPTSIARLVRDVPNGEAYIVISFGPQSIGEETFWQAAPAPIANDQGSENLKSPPVKARLAGPSRLAFKVPDATDHVPFDDGSLLAWEQWEPRVVPAALPPVVLRPNQQPPRPTLRAPHADETQIELPWHLYLSPHAQSAWAHALEPVTRDDRTELWHTRLAVAKGNHEIDEADETKRTVRAVWSVDFNGPKPKSDDLGPFRMPLTPLDRWELVHLTSNFKLHKYLPKPVKVDRLMLTSLGAWINSRGDWTGAPNFLNIEHWTERGTMGREHYVRVVKRGFLYPTKHPAALIQISERKIQKVEKGPLKGQYAAYLRKRAFIVPKQPLQGYSARNMPFKSIRMRTIVTPDLDKYDGNGVGNNHPTAVTDKNGKKYGEAAFWPRVGGQDFLFNMVGTDADGQEIELSTPLIFVLNSTATNPSDMEQVTKVYEKSQNKDRRNRPLQGQRMAYAPPTPGKPGDTSFETKSFMLGGEKKNSGTPRFEPRMMQADVRLSAVEAIKGPLATATVLPHPVYLDHGLNHAQNKTESFLKLKDAVGLDYGAGSTGDRCGGLGAPNMQITGLSRTLGPTGGPPNAAPPNFNPADFLQGAKFLGIEFADVLVSGLNFLSEQEHVPKTVSETLYPGGDKSKPPTEIRTRLDWVPKLQADPLQLFEPQGPDGPASMLLQALFVTPLNPPGEPDFTVTGDLRSFRLNLFGKPDAFLILHFNRVVIDAKKGQKPNVDVDITNVEFAGALSFVNQLKELMKSNGNGFDLDISPTQVAAGYTVAFPSASAGVFTLSHIAFTAGVTIPFTGKPVTARFAFCSREQPMLLAYTIFGGGAYFEINVGAHGVEQLKLAFEFGAQASIDLGVASGSVSIMAGIYMEFAEDNASLTGYVRLNGNLSVIGLIHASLEFYLGMTYDFGDDRLWGECTLTIEVEVLMFSGSVSAHAEKTFAGGGGSSKAKLKGGVANPEPIRFEELMTEGEWQTEYVPAFDAAAF